MAAPFPGGEQLNCLIPNLKFLGRRLPGQLAVRVAIHGLEFQMHHGLYFLDFSGR